MSGSVSSSTLCQQSTLFGWSLWHVFFGLTALLAGCAVQQKCPLSELGEPPQIGTDNVDEELVDFVTDLLEQIQKNPRSSTLRGRLAMTYDVNSFQLESVEAYEQASVLDPYEFQWSYFGALMSAGVGDYDGAIEKINWAVQIDDSYIPAWLSRGHWMLERGDLDLAEESFQTAADLGAGSPSSVGLAMVWLRREDYQQTVELLEPVNRELPHPQIFRLLARAYTGIGDSSSAEVATALGRSPEPLRWIDPLRRQKDKYIRGFGPRLVHAQNLMKGDHAKPALELLESLRRQRPNDEALINNLAWAYSSTNQHERASEVLQHGINMYPDQARNYTMLAFLMYRGGHLDDALRLVDQSIEIQPNAPDSYEVRGRVLLRLERLDEAVRAFERSIAAGSDKRIELTLAIGTIDAMSQRWDDAIERFQDVVERAPGTTDAHIFLVKALIASERLGEAQDALLWAERLGINPTELAKLYMQWNQRAAEAE